MATDEHTTDDLSPGEVRRVGPWAVGRTPSGDFAVSARCRHQLADLSKGTVDADGCLVCPWHQSRFDVTNGEMVAGPRGVFGWHGTPKAYATLVLVVARHLRLRVGRVLHHDGRLSVRR